MKTAAQITFDRNLASVMAVFGWATAPLAALASTQVMPDGYAALRRIFETSVVTMDTAVPATATAGCLVLTAMTAAIGACMSYAAAQNNRELRLVRSN